MTKDRKWEGHQGLDYTVVMTPGEGTDDASISIHTGDMEEDDKLAIRLRDFLNSDGAPRSDKVKRVDWSVAGPLVDELRGGEGHSVTFNCDNPDFNELPDCAIDVCGDWTGWVDARFAGDTIVECLQAAVEAMKAVAG